ncbi:conserved protein, unknown function [Hepatocystis sp. ex Piliocolobus tephrosceles]|nr:conserved protein, unknown function [Hepatocystis sp. ex Piliocolobus tephrosceles]
MAGQSEKKRLKKAGAFILYALTFFSIFSIVYILFTVYYKQQLITRNIIFLHCLLYFCYYFTLKKIHYCLENGLSYTYYSDILILSFIINLGLFYSFKFFYIYIIIPLYAIFKVFNFIFKNFLSSPVMGAADTANKMEKKEKQKTKIVYKKVH